MTFARGEGLDRAIAVARSAEAAPRPSPAGQDAQANAAQDTNTQPQGASESAGTQTMVPDATGPDTTGPDTTDTQIAAADAAASDAEADDQEPVRVVALHSTARMVDSAVLLRGQTEAARSVELRSETSSIVESEPLTKGTMVHKGDLLCKLESGTRETALAEAQARLAEAETGPPTDEARVAEAEARLEEAQINFNAAEKLSDSGFASNTTLASARASVRSAEATLAAARAGLSSTRAAIQSARAAVATAQKEIDRLAIHAPFDGLLESDTAELGSFLQAGGLCATVIGLDPIRLVGYMPETDVERARIGAPAQAQLSASGTQVTGQVTFLSRSADPTTRTFRVEVTVPNPDFAIRDGQTASIAIQAPGVDAHLLPQSALTLNDDGTLGVRVVADDDRAAFVPVSLLRDTADGVLLTGLPENADVITIGQEYIVAGVPVLPTFTDPDAPAAEPLQ
ncbi:efflux RND transporter periplasmic adaptor subunit [Pseudooceanicola sediminis]|uniref:Efflux RND transporter periplasmic adaptor subunit n=2 Tax=Pseudooceanicola sediminis TaxID=2211117 RepID=A0A399IY60_9RHOB|nr:efflux RND transporter periplasmic adaptor subunit [Puniceibacterium sp. HSS470]RII38118.1 efflux RND transporter periplasmic adaptor subunit [Pseudooceanicola sediminis]